MVATVGVLDVHPNAFSVVPGRVDFTLQVRDLCADTMESFVEDVCKKFDLRYEISHQSEPALCDKKIMEFISQSCGDLKSIEMPSRASHEDYLLSNGYDICSINWWYQSFSERKNHRPDVYQWDKCFKQIPSE